MGNVLTSAKAVESLNGDKYRIEYVPSNYYVLSGDDLTETCPQIHIYNDKGEHYQNFLAGTEEWLFINGESAEESALPSDSFEVASITVAVDVEKTPGLLWGDYVQKKYEYTFHLPDGTRYKICVPLYKAF